MLHRFVRYTCRHAGNNIAPSHGRRQFQFLARTIRQKTKRKQGTAINGVSFRKRFFALRKTNGYLLTAKFRRWTLPEETAKKLPDTQLYNLKNDTTQLQNVLISHPEIAWEMKRELEAIKTKG